MHGAVQFGTALRRSVTLLHYTLSILFSKNGVLHCGTPFLRSFANHKFIRAGHDNIKEGVEMKRVLILLAFVFCLPLWGCSGRSDATEPSKCRIVTEITIQVNHGSEPTLSRYSDSSKISKALNYLRRLDVWDPPDQDPAAAPGDRYRIAVYFSDGSAAYYDQIGLEYFREAAGPWKKIDPEHALRLPLLLAAVPSDTI